MNYKRGLYRLWIIASVIWLVAISITHGEAIGFYVGFHYGLFTRAPSWQAALEEKDRMETFSQLCKRASETACPLERDEASYTQCIRTLAPRGNMYDCMSAPCDREKYLQHAKVLFATAGFPTDRLTAQACDNFQVIEVPYINWMWIGAVVVIPIVLPLILWLFGAWIARGFALSARRT